LERSRLQGQVRRAPGEYMKQAELLDTVINTMSREVGIAAEGIGMETTLEGLNIDSLDVLRIAESFEKTFQIRISTAELLKIRTVGDIVAGLETKLTT
jgi:acyl carrier protein